MRNTLYILGDLDDRDLIWLSGAGTLRNLAEGERLIEAGHELRELFFLLDGSLAVLLPDGRQVAVLQTGDVVGEMSFVEKRPPSATVRAIDAARVLAIPRTAILERLAQDVAFAARFYRALAVFLSDRLRAATTGAAVAPEDGAGELDEAILDNVHVAGDRFLRLLRLLEGQS
jgi:CRP-like cAMP-binding protein